MEHLPEEVAKGTEGLLPRRDPSGGKSAAFLGDAGNWSGEHFLHEGGRAGTQQLRADCCTKRACPGVSGSSDTEWSLLKMQTASFQSQCNSELLRKSLKMQIPGPCYLDSDSAGWGGP